MELFLTSSVHAVAHDIVQRVDLKKGNRLVFIITPTEPEEDVEEWLPNDRKALVNAGFDVSDYTFTGKASAQIESDLNPYDFIYMSGGNTAYTLQQSQKTGFISLIKKFIREKGKIYIGTSAGSIIAGPRLPDYFKEEEIKLEGRECYGFVNFTLVPHWGSEDFKERYLGERLKTVYNEEQVPFLLLTDNQYVHVKDNDLQIIDLTH